MIQHPENKALKERIFDVLRDYTHGMFFMDFKFLGFDEVNIETIDEFSITQDFMNNYSDIITCTLTLLPWQMIEVVQAYQDLRCSITITKSEINTGILLPQYDPIQLEYRVLIENPLDLLKQLNSKEFLKPEEQPDNEQYQPIRVPLSMQLVTQEIYDLRHIEFTDNLKDVTVEQALNHFATIFKCEDIKIVPPDNTREYEHMPIPPMLNFSNAFSFLQERYGVYSYDIGAYFTEKTLLVFPKNENVPREPLAPGTVHIYKAGIDQYVGSDGYTSKIGEDYHILCTKPTDIQDLSEANAETMGNAQVVTRSDMAIDTNREVIEDGIEQLPEEAITIINPNSNTAVPGIQNAKYIKSQDNMYQLMSAMSAEDCATAQISFLYLDPFSILPNHPMILHYEEDGEYKTVKGSISACKYSLDPNIARPSRYQYGFQCSIVARLVPDKKEGMIG